jgi:vacuolar-type H+-ATPase subunit I/STV1
MKNTNLDINAILEEYGLKISDITKENIIQKVYIKQLEQKLNQLEAELTALKLEDKSKG